MFNGILPKNVPNRFGFGKQLSWCLLLVVCWSFLGCDSEPACELTAKSGAKVLLIYDIDFDESVAVIWAEALNAAGQKVTRRIRVGWAQGDMHCSNFALHEGGQYLGLYPRNQPEYVMLFANLDVVDNKKWRSNEDFDPRIREALSRYVKMDLKFGGEYHFYSQRFLGSKVPEPSQQEQQDSKREVRWGSGTPSAK